MKAVLALVLFLTLGFSSATLRNRPTHSNHHGSLLASRDLLYKNSGGIRQEQLVRRQTNGSVDEADHDREEGGEEARDESGGRKALHLQKRTSRKSRRSSKYDPEAARQAAARAQEEAERARQAQEARERQAQVDETNARAQAVLEEMERARENQRRLNEEIEQQGKKSM